MTTRVVTVVVFHLVALAVCTVWAWVMLVALFNAGWPS
jgi:hypothetical protein